MTIKQSSAFVRAEKDTPDPQGARFPASVEIDPMWPTSTVAEVLNVPVPTLRWWRSKGIGPKSFRLGSRRVVYRRSEVLAWIAAQEAKGGDAA